jgi:hypothetical protein
MQINRAHMRSTRYCNSRTRPDDLFLIHNLIVAPVTTFFHAFDFLHPESTHACINERFMSAKLRVL